MMKFKSKMDGNVLFSTASLIILFLGIMILVLTNISFSSGYGRAAVFVGSLGLLLVLANGQVRFYEIRDTSVRIARLFNSIYIPISSIESLAPIDGSLLSGSVRKRGSNGFFGYTGIFLNQQFGIMHWFMTNRSSVVCVQLLNHETYFLSPNNASLFCKQVIDIASKTI